MENLLEGFSEAELLAIRAQAKADITAGRVITSWSSGNTSTSKQISLSPVEMLRHVRTALKILNPDDYGALVTKAVCTFR